MALYQFNSTFALLPPLPREERQLRTKRHSGERVGVRGPAGTPPRRPHFTRHALTVLSVALVFAGCSSETTLETPAPSSQPSKASNAYLLSSAPADPQDVIPMREAIEDDQEVVVIGRIGGEQPWVEGLAAFSLVDRSLAACSDIPGDNCPTPWDYCCRTDQLPAATTLVKVVDDQGQIIPTGAQELLGVSELQTLVITGKAQKDEAGNVTVLASGIYVDPTNPGQVKYGDHDHPHDHEDGEQHSEVEPSAQDGKGDASDDPEQQP